LAGNFVNCEPLDDVNQFISPFHPLAVNVFINCPTVRTGYTTFGNVPIDREQVVGLECVRETPFTERRLRVAVTDEPAASVADDTVPDDDGALHVFRHTAVDEKVEGDCGKLT
jgi:hypothetical protein